MACNQRPQPVRNPNWSLGKYVGTEVRFVEEKKEAAGASKGKGKKGGKAPPAGEEGAAAARTIDHVIDHFEGCVCVCKLKDRGLLPAF